MSLLDYIRIIIRRGWIIVLAVIITATAAFGFSKLQTEEYRATQKVLLLPARNDLGLSETLRILLRSFVEYLNTDEVARIIIETLELDMQPGELRSNTTINSDPTTLTIQIDVDLTDGPQAAAIATEWGRQLVIFRDQENNQLRREDRIEARLLDTASFGLYRPNTQINVVAGAVLGLLVGAVVVFVLEYLESNILRSATDVNLLDLLASIPEEG
ncbi:MAG: Wzz/FepE/Etk N-terminal domain-containing protein [Chloroflexi bacterium]|nr:Wzz/FepE/Etk N-terminal domain-containing protein [Chloroflexota bacterium]